MGTCKEGGTLKFLHATPFPLFSTLTHAEFDTSNNAHDRTD
jgi:hypothetical protein